VDSPCQSAKTDAPHTPVDHIGATATICTSPRRRHVVALTLLITDLLPPLTRSRGREERRRGGEREEEREREKRRDSRREETFKCWPRWGDRPM